MKHKLIALLLTVTLFLTGCNTADNTDSNQDVSTISTSTEEVLDLNERIYPDNAFMALDIDYTNNTWAPQGSVVSFTYETKNHLSEDDTVYEKTALVYLPACYDETDTETRYNVLYLMHGGSDSPEWFFGEAGGYSRITRMMDSMIANGEMEPLIVCAVTYYTEYCSDYTENCLNFHHELMNDIIPVFETQYHTYAENVTPEGLAASRLHRAFGGFSMGAVTTWSVLENCINEFAYFLPISGDCWAFGNTAGGRKPVQTAERLAWKITDHDQTAEDFYIYAGCGSNDIAEPNLTPQIEAMKNIPEVFTYCDNFADGNLYHCIYENGGHDVNTVINILYNGLPKMFG